MYAGGHAEAQLSKTGLSAYAEQQFLRTVSLDRSFYRPLTTAQYSAYAAQVARAGAAQRFRFTVKAPAAVCDALLREEGRAGQANPLFLNPEFAWKEALEPASSGLQAQLGVLVFQLSPLPAPMLRRMPEVLERLDALLSDLVARPQWRALAPNAVLAVEVRNAEFVGTEFGPEFAKILKAHGAAYCLGLHAKMPSAAGQLPMLRALWPGPLVARWNLHSKHGAFGYQTAKNQYEPFNQLVDEDLETRETLARVIAATTRAGHSAQITINNKAEGSAPRSVVELLRSVDAAFDALDLVKTQTAGEEKKRI